MAETITIYDVTTRAAKYTALYEKGSIRRFLIMTEDFVKLVFNASKKIAFGLGDYISVQGYGTFEITKVQRPRYNAQKSCYEYSLQFDAPYFKWNNKKYKFEPSSHRNEITWSLTDNITNQMAVFRRNLAYYGWNYTVDLSTMSEADRNKVLLVQFDDIFILDALTKIAEAWGVEWWITNNIIHLGRVDNGGTYTDFEVGVNCEDMTASDSSGKDYCTVLYAFGSERNIPSNYRRTAGQVLVNGIVQKRLMMPTDTPYIELAGITANEQRVEGVVIFDDIYPRTEDVITQVTPIEKTIEDTDESTGEAVTQTATFYRFKCRDLKFSSSYVLPNQTLQVVFTSGLLNGMTFDVVFNPEKKAEKKPALDGGTETTAWNDEAQVFEIVRSDTYGLFLPNATLKPAAQDTFCLIGWDVTKEADLGLIARAELALKARAEAYMEKLQLDPNNYTCPMMADYMAGVDGSGNLDPNYAKSFDLGDRINLVNENYFASGSRQSRVIGYEYQLDFPEDEAKVIVGENVTYNRFRDIKDTMDGKFDEVNFQNNTYSNGSNGGSFYVITSNDNTPESDHNVYSAKRTLQRFTRKTVNENISALWTFLYGGGTRRGIRTKDYENAVNEDNFFGHGFELVMKENGISRLEIDELFVRAKAFFANLEIRQMSYVGGNFVFSAAGSKIYYVEKLDEDGDYDPDGNAKYYRCYLYSDDGTTATTNRWVENDQALCQTFNIDSGVHQGTQNKRYWRLVTSTGKQLIVSKALAALKRQYDEYLAAINNTIAVTAADEAALAAQRSTLAMAYNHNATLIRNGIVPTGCEGDDFTEYRYVDLSNMPGEYEAGSGVPEAEDAIVQFGNQTPNSTRKGLVYIKVEGNGSPALIVYDAITSFNIPANQSVQLSPHGNIIHGTFYSVASGKSLEDIISEGDVKVRFVTLCENLWQTSSEYLKTGTHHLGLNVNFTPASGSFYYQKPVVNDQNQVVTQEGFFKCEDGVWESYGNGAILDLVRAIYEVVGDKKLTIYSTIPVSGASEYDLCLRGTTWYDGYNTQGTQGAVEISIYKDGVWELLKESVNGVIANLGSEIRAEIYGVDGSSGIRATLTELQAFTQKITFDNDGNITNISKSGLITQSNFATVFATNVDAQGVAKTAEITAYIDNQISGISLVADIIDLQGQVTANGDFSISTDGTMRSRNSVLTNVLIDGIIASPFVYESSIITYKWDDDGTHEYYAAMAKDNLIYNSSEHHLYWDSSCSGRLITLCQYESFYGEAVFNAPSGKYFYEAGIKRSSIRVSRQCVILKGYGMSNTFWGYIVVKRIDLATERSYGRETKCLAYGKIVFNSSNNSISLTATTFDGSTLTATRNGEGEYQVSIPSSWRIVSGKLFAMVNPMSEISGGSNPLYGGIKNYISTYDSEHSENIQTGFVIQLGDDTSRNDGDVQFMLFNSGDFEQL